MLAMRRRRAVWNAADLLRMCMAYGLCDMSLRQTAAWASAIGLGEISNVAVLNRLRGCEAWLGHLVAQKLAERGVATNVPGAQVSIVDATSLTAPGGKGTDWRLHVGLSNLRAKDDALARTYLYSKILGAILVEELSGHALAFFPWGFQLPREARQPLAHLLAVDRSTTHGDPRHADAAKP